MGRLYVVGYVIIDRRLRKETILGEEPFGFMPGRGTTDVIFAARQVNGETAGYAEGTAQLE